MKELAAFRSNLEQESAKSPLGYRTLTQDYERGATDIINQRLEQASNGNVQRGPEGAALPRRVRVGQAVRQSESLTVIRLLVCQPAKFAYTGTGTESTISCMTSSVRTDFFMPDEFIPWMATR